MTRNLEILFFAIVNYLPYVPIGFYPFRDNLRFKKSITYLLITFQVLVIVANHFAVEHGLRADVSTVITTITSVSMLFLINRDSLGKMVMTLLIIQNLALLIMNLAKYMETIFFPENAVRNYTWSHACFMLLWQLIIMVPFFIYMKKVYIPAIFTNHNKKIWRMLWMIPFTFYVFWQYIIWLFDEIQTYGFRTRTYTIVMLLLLSAGSFVIYHMTALLLLEQVRSESYALQNRTMRFQYDNIQERIQEARRNRHDIRHHLTLIDQYLMDGKYEECREYLQQYQRSIPHEEAMTYCEHYATNALLTYLVQHGKEFGIFSNIKVSFPKKMPYSTEDLTIIFANLLENALEACRLVAVSGKQKNPEVKVSGLYENEMLIFRVENPSIQEAKQGDSQIYISTKHDGYGVGIESVRTIAEKYHGSLKITQGEGTFTANVILHL